MKRMLPTGAVLLSVLSWIACCSDQIRSESLSPDGTLKATWFVRDCGATTDFSTIISLHRPHDSYRDSDGFVFVTEGRGPLRVVWDGPRRLTIECTSCQRKLIFRMVTVVGGVDISYSIPDIAGAQQAPP